MMKSVGDLKRCEIVAWECRRENGQEKHNII